MESEKEQFINEGFVYIKNLLPPEDVGYYRDLIENLSGISSTNFYSFGGKGDLTSKLLRKKNYRLYVKPGMVTSNEKFWNLPIHPNILKNVRRILGDDARFLQNDSIAAGFSSPGWHRDSVHRTFGVGADYDESKHPYRLMRIGIYLQSYEESQFRFGVIPKSHRQESSLQRFERSQKWLTPLRTLIKGQDLFFSQSKWFKTEPGDAILFDPRLLHCGSYINGPKYSVYLAYGIENEHYANHYSYYMHDRDDHPYEEMQSELLDKLKTAGVKPDHILSKKD